MRHARPNRVTDRPRRGNTNADKARTRRYLRGYLAAIEARDEILSVAR